MLSLKFHPDRLEEKDKESGEERFKVVSMIYTILFDDEKRRIYDETGIISELGTWGEDMGPFFKPILDTDTEACRKEYIGK